MSSIYRNQQIETQYTLVSEDAKQRNLFFKKNVPVERNLGGEAVTTYETVVCAEPSPDFASVLATAIAGNLSTPEDIAVALSRSTNETGANIGLRSQSIQLLRDAAYRVCEAYAAGALDSVDYATLLRRNQVFTTAVLAVEQLTGSSQATPVVIGGTANVLAGEALVQAQTLVDQQRAKVQQAAATVAADEQNLAKLKLDPAKSSEAQAAEKKLAESKIAKAEADNNLKSLEQTRDAARQPSLQLGSVALGASKVAGAAQSANARVAEAVQEIVNSAFTANFMVDVCQMFWTGKTIRIYGTKREEALGTVCGIILDDIIRRNRMLLSMPAPLVGPGQ